MNISFVDDQKLQISWEWYEQVLAFNYHQNIILPYDHIQSISTSIPASSWAEIKSPGLTLPGVMKVGTYYSSRGKEFWYVTQEQNYLTLELTNENWQRIIITVDDHQTWAEQIKQHLLINS